MKDLGVLESLADEHWEENRPIWYKRLKRIGKLNAELERAARMTEQALDASIKRKQELEPLPSDPTQAEAQMKMIEREAWEAVLEMYIYLPSEEDEEELEKDAEMDVENAEIEVRFRHKLIVEWTEKWKAFKKEDFETEQDYLDTVALTDKPVLTPNGDTMPVAFPPPSRWIVMTLFSASVMETRRLFAS
jgi:hypothetical protein